MRKSSHLFAAAILLALAASLLRRRIFHRAGQPGRQPEARAHKAVLTIKASGCQAEKAAITGTAIGASTDTASPSR